MFVRALLLLLATQLILRADDALPILTLDSLADVYYDAESGDAIVSDEIKALNGKTVRIAGYMVPFNSLENLQEFMLMPSSNGCNFCESPMKEEIVYIRQPGKGNYEFIPDPLLITGKLWVHGAGTPAKNSTHAQFLYAFEQAHVEKLAPEHYPLLETVTPRTIIKQVCSLLRVRLLRQVKFAPLSADAYRQQRQAALLPFLGGADQAQQLQQFLTAFDVPHADQLIELGTTYLEHWSSAFSDRIGSTIYYRDDLDLSDPQNQRQLAIACYDVLFHHEVDMGTRLHEGTPSYDEYLARISLLMGLRQSFTQFYGSIGLVDMLPLEEFTKPHRETTALPSPYSTIAQQLLLANKGFIEQLYAAEHYQPYTKALSAPPVTMAQILTPTLYTQSAPGTPYAVPAIEGYANRLGPYLASLVVGTEHSAIIADGLRLTPTGFTWVLQCRDATTAAQIATAERSSTLTSEVRGDTVTFRAGE